MVKDDILVVKCNMTLRARDFTRLQHILLEQKKSGVIVLPRWCDAIFVPKDVEVRVQKGGEKDGRNL